MTDGSAQKSTHLLQMIKYRTSTSGFLATLVPSLAQFLVVADTTIISVAMPSIRTSLTMSAYDQTWVVNAYLIVFGGLLIVGGRCGDLLGRVRVFMAGLGVLAVASLLGGLAINAEMLIAARALQGVAAALIAPVPLALVTAMHADPAARVRAVAVWNAVAASGLAAGTVLGGLLVGTVGWRWVLFVNVPAAVLITVAARLVLPRDRGQGSWHEVDIPGGILGTVGLAAAIYALSAAQSSAWTSFPVAGPLVVAAAALTGFGVVQARVVHPLVRPSLLRQRGVAAGNLGMLLSGAIVTTTIFFVSLLLQEVRGYTALSAALAMVPLTVAIPLASTQTVRLLRGIGPRAHLAVFATITALGLAWQSVSAPHGSYATSFLGPGVVIGVGLGGVGVAIASAAMAVPAGDSGAASALAAVARQIGGSLGVALLVTPAIGDRAAADTLHAYSASLLFGSGIAVALALVAVLIPGPAAAQSGSPSPVLTSDQGRTGGG
jgi:EmrB/QacA subfamily drug resistance transporter